ncbi:hypothetical protein F2Q69_00056893, partial [Brassica cretica]
MISILARTGYQPCKKNSDCARLKCPSPLGHPTCVKGGCECAFEEHTVLPADDTNCDVAACFDYCKAKGEEQASRPHRPLPQPQTPADAITVRTDAVWLPVRNLAGLGWVVFSSPCNIPHKKHLEFVASPLMAEGLALREAVRSCALDKMEIVSFESDSAQLIKTINKRNCVPELYGVISDILSFAAVFKSAYFSWIPRERNILADTLAKEVLFV